MRESHRKLKSDEKQQIIHERKKAHNCMKNSLHLERSATTQHAQMRKENNSAIIANLMQPSGASQHARALVSS